MRKGKTMPGLHKRLLTVLMALLVGTTCVSSECGAPLPAPFPEEPRVYDGVQLHFSNAGLQVLGEMVPILAMDLLTQGDPLVIPTQTEEILWTETTICETPCPAEIEIVSARIQALSPNRINVTTRINLTSTITVDSDLGHCEFPLELKDKPVTAEIDIGVDPLTNFLKVEFNKIDIHISNSDTSKIEEFIDEMSGEILCTIVLSPHKIIESCI